MKARFYLAFHCIRSKGETVGIQCVYMQVVTSYNNLIVFIESNLPSVIFGRTLNLLMLISLQVYPT
jgi:hypothetical protein